MKKISLFYFILTMLQSSIANAEMSSALPENLSLHGFITQGLIKSDSNNKFYGSAGDWSTDYTELGLTARYDFGRIALAGQLIYLNNQGPEDGLDLDFAFADVELFDNESSNLHLKLGRIPLNIGFYNATRDVAKTRPSAILAQEIYPARSRSMYFSADGASLQLNYFASSFDLTAGIDAGYLREESIEEVKVLNLGFNPPGKLESELSTNSYIRVNLLNGMLDLGFTRSEPEYDYEPAALPPTDPLLAGQTGATMDTYSAAVYLDNWEFVYEYQDVTLERKNFGPFVPGINSTLYPIGQYIQITYIQPDFHLYTRFGENYIDRDDKDGTGFAAATGQPASNFYTKSRMIGGRYYLDDNMAINAEIHDMDGSMVLPYTGNTNPFTREKDWKLYVLQFTWSF